MKGQRLFVREATVEDEPHIRALASSAPAHHVAFIGKLVGGVVAYAGFQLDSSRREAQLVSICVAESLRRKRVGTVLMREASELLRARGVERIVAKNAPNVAGEFLKSLGFNEEGEFLAKDLFSSS